MVFVLLVLLGVLCLIVPTLLYRSGKVSRMTVYFWLFFGLSAFINGLYLHFHPSTAANRWSGLIVPALVQVPFAVMIYILEIKGRSPLYAVLMAFLGSFLMTGLWLMTSIFFVG